MITSKLKGGLGNQMFQYACGRALSLRANPHGSNQRFRIDVSNFYKKHSKDTPRTFTLGHFNIHAEIIGASEHSMKVGELPPDSLFKKILRKLLRAYNIGFDEKVFRDINVRAAEGKEVVLDGYWWSEKYFKDAEAVIRRDFTLKEAFGSTASEIAKNIHGASPAHTVSIHVRRGDYVNNPETNVYHGSCTLEYYQNAVNEVVKAISPNPLMLFVFSDDIEWTAKNLRFPFATHYVPQDGIPDYEAVVLMSMCDHHIVANSSFSWWGAWLDQKKEKIVIAPERWTQKEIAGDHDMIPAEWIRL